MKAILDKLRHEWKTFLLSILSTAIGLHDAVAAAGYDLTPWIPEDKRAIVIPAIGISFLLLRRWVPQD